MTQSASLPPVRPSDGAQGARRRPGKGWAWAAGIIGAGIPAGLLWWLLAPGGQNLVSGNSTLSSGTNTAGWLPRDLVLAGLFVLAGCLVAVLLSGRRDGGTRRMLLLSVAASAAAAVLAWQTGVLAGLWLGGPQDTSANASVAFSLRSLTVLVLWPAAVAAGFFVLRIIGLLRASVDQNVNQQLEGNSGDGRAWQ
ncbi:hypothetical protein ARGLB_051_01050 [Arthrobacter globiformis NBRC 12137]|uniref:DUF2567 domain-containing protein n=1 Tax=Arthrobacter globiformis (strain ATCC 8010 / DSM 20124 / JCM 1332 / NBRC 12137 / NCIMB 8907 / NRRL B-2979 / 168) TaxID=1077972 RepID=H0QM73_ARTG1|nr:hypothetical protein [Arthrobacter globiformis]GAB13924.1 hypothetical protein ARGLB_051_01050 [Arthrobacter globiformis NBRC 12137]